MPKPLSESEMKLINCREGYYGWMGFGGSILQVKSITIKKCINHNYCKVREMHKTTFILYQIKTSITCYDKLQKGKSITCNILFRYVPQALGKWLYISQLTT